jgi:heme/copper-type cytochrome/quinol oxidase subunit 3
MSMIAAVQAPPAVRVEPARFGVWLFLVSEAMFFAALAAAFVVLREGSSTFGGPGGALGFGAGAARRRDLDLASVWIERAARAPKGEGSARTAAPRIAGTRAFGLLFLALQVVEVRALFVHGISPRTNLFWSSWFVMSGVHALHVLGGVVWAAILCNRDRSGTGRLGVRLGALYWHFVGLVGLALFFLLYT